MKLFYKRHDEAANRFLEKVDAAVREQISGDREIYFFGHSHVSVMAISHIHEVFPDRKIGGFVDNDAKKYALGERDGRYEFRVQPVSAISSMKGRVVVLIASKHHECMAEQLRGMGFVDGEEIISVTDLSEEEHAFNLTAGDDFEEVSTRDIKLLQLEMLRYIRQICDENGILYYLAYGTLLGAVRDQGMIPWDDDTDIFIWGKDYDRFADIVNRDGRYQMIYLKNCEEFYNDLGQLVNPRFIKDRNLFPMGYTTGITVDVFPLWNQPDDTEKENFILDYRLREEAIFEEFGRHGTIRDAMFERERFWSFFTDDDSENVGFMHWGYYSEVFKRKWFEDTVEFPLDGEMFKVPVGFDDLLKNTYGAGYMSPPQSLENIVHRSHYYVNADPEIIGDGIELARDRKIMAEGKLKYDMETATASEAAAIEIPEEWESKLIKQDGNRKKVILFDTGAGAVLHYRAAMLDKLEDCLAIFADNSQDITVLWQTRGNGAGLIKDQALQDRYRGLLQRFLTSGMGIYDDSTDYARAVGFCDAYYGDGGAVAQMVKEAGKPVMIMNVEILSGR